MKPPRLSPGDVCLPTPDLREDEAAGPVESKDVSGRSKKRANTLMALSSAVVFAVYMTGYLRTQPAAERFEAESARRRLPVATAPRALTLPRLPAPASTKTIATAEPPVDMAKPSKGTALALKAAAALKSIAAPKPIPSATLAAPVAAPAVAAPVNPTGAESAQAAEQPAAPAAPAQPQYKDGTYTGWGSCRHGDIQASVVVEGGRIVSASIAQCWTRYSCSWVSHLPGQVVARQSAEVDYVSGATQSGNAFYYAVIDALNKAK